MRYVLLVCVVGLAITCDLAVLTASSDITLETFDPLHPATLLPVVVNGLDALRGQVGEAANDLVEWFTAPYRERLRHETSSPALEP
jgi:hypothetical protein